MNISNYNSQKISIVSFLMIIMVVYIHSYYLEAEAFVFPFAIQHCGQVLCAVAVPMFFAISGFLFFKNVEAVNDTVPQIRKRIRTLLVPYLIWNLIFILWYVALALVPGVSKYVNSDMLGELSIQHPLDTFRFVFIDPAGFHLWFLRDLILFVILSPILYLLMKRLHWFALLLIIVLTGWMTGFWMSSFVLGGILAVHHAVAIDVFRNNKRFVLVCIILSLLVPLLFATNLLSFETKWIENYFMQLYIFIPIVAVWGGYDLLVSESYQISDCMKKILGYTFFVYLFHEPAFNIIKKLGLKICGVNDVSLVVLYLINPLIICFISIVVAIVFHKILPKTYSIFVGGRVAR